MAAVRRPASTETAVQLQSEVGWTQSFARTRGRSRRTRDDTRTGGGGVHHISFSGREERGVPASIAGGAALSLLLRRSVRLGGRRTHVGFEQSPDPAVLI